MLSALNHLMSVSPDLNEKKTFLNQH
jgi:hypothetical protein